MVLALDIEVDSLAAALIGLGGEVLEHVRVDRPRGHSSLVAIVDDLAGLAAIVAARRRPEHASIGIGVAVAGIVRRADGLVSMAPNLGWTDQPLGDRLGARPRRRTSRSRSPTRPTSAPSRSSRRGAAVGADHVLFVSGEVGVGGGLIVDGRPFTGVAGYGGEVGHLPVNPAGRACTLRRDRLLGDRGRRDAPPPARRADPHGGGPAEIDALLARRGGGLTGRRSPRSTRPVAGSGSAWPACVNVLNPRLVVFGGLFQRIHPYVAAIVDAELDRRALPAPRRLVRVVAGPSAPRRPCSAPRSSPSSPSSPIRPLAAPAPPWTVPKSPKIAVRRVVA